VFTLDGALKLDFSFDRTWCRTVAVMLVVVMDADDDDKW
jgi:hypothetical protein